MGDLTTGTARHISGGLCSKAKDCLNHGTDKCYNCHVQGKMLNFEEKPCQKI